MAPLESKLNELDEKTMDSVVKFVSTIRSGKLRGSKNIAIATVDLLEQIISDAENTNALALISKVRAAGRTLVKALPAELSAHNMVRRVLRAVRDEQRSHANQSVEGAGESLQRLVLATPSRRATLGPTAQDLREPIRDHIAELRAELDSSTSAICSQAKEHVHADELILTYGASGLVERFLRASATKRFRLLMAEGTEVSECHAMASRLATAGVSVTVISSAAVGALMPRVNKVVVGALGALSGGAALASAGLLAVTTAAAHRAVSVIVLSPLYKLSPLHACDRQHFSTLAPAHKALPYMSFESAVARVICPQYDLVPHDHITLFITNLGGSSPSYIYRLLSELYDPMDYQL
uniref:Translation initiation factor eIF2B subunit beta n=1 Tax=Pararge aegeria TaxID=116150 RepID=S4NTZ6_9NEOP